MCNMAHLIQTEVYFQHFRAKYLNSLHEAIQLIDSFNASFGTLVNEQRDPGLSR